MVNTFKAYKRAIATGLCSILFAGAIAGCSADSNEPVESGGTATSAESASPNTPDTEHKGTYPIATADNPITLKVWAGADNVLKHFKDYNEVIAFQEMEKATGIRIEWIHPSAGQLQEPFNLMVASRDLPDVILYPWGNTGFLPGGAQAYANDGVIIPISDYMEYAPEYAKVLEDYPDIKKRVTDDEGKMYFISLMQPDLTMRTYNGFMIRQDWLDKVGLDMPKSTDELYHVLKTFQEKDVNGNGKKDEYFSATGMDKGLLGIEKLMYPFGATAGNEAMTQEDGKVVYSPLKPEYKEAAAFLAKLYDEGLLDPEYLLNDNTKLQQKYTNETVGASYSSAGRIVGWTNTLQESNPDAVLAPIPSLVGPNGQGYWYESNTANITNPGVSLAITTANKHVAETMAWWDWVFTKEGSMAFNYGKEGTTYTMVDGKPQFTEMITNDSQGRTQNEMLSLTAPAATLPTLNELEATKLQKSEMEWNAFETWGNHMLDNSRILPPLTFNDEEMAVITAKKPAIDDYQKQMLDKFITGRESLDRWESVFVDQLQKLGIQELIAAFQSAFDRFNQR